MNDTRIIDLRGLPVFISGAVTGLNYSVAFARFEEVERMLRTYGCEPINPCKIAPNIPGKQWKEYMLECLDELFDAPAVFFLSNWKDSQGARIEHAIAIEMNKMMVYEDAEND